jgi:glycosyltransferase involved in cell wall biosynthesis
VRIAFEMQFKAGTATGLGVYAAGLAQALRQRDDLELVELGDSRFDLWRFDRRVFWDQVRAPQLARKAKADVTHFTGGTLPVFMPHPCVLTLHDLAWLEGATRARPYANLYFGALQAHLAPQADRIATDTATAREDIIRHLRVDPAKVVVVGAGVDASWLSLERSVTREQPFFLCVGTIEERKDFQTAVRALAAFADHRLVIAGPRTNYADAVMQTAAESGVGDRVELRGYIDQPSLRTLYARATALIFPSRYEGFGLPPLQALAGGLPVVASDITVLREVLDDCVLWAKPGEANSFVDGLKAVVNHDASVAQKTQRGRVRAREFTWAAVAGRVAQLYRDVAENA